MDRETPELRLLIVEDESIVAMMIEDVIAELGHKVAGVAARIDQALDLANRLDIDLAFIDVNLNGIHSYPVAEVLRARGIPFIFVTGYGAAGLIEGWKDARVVAKPFQPEELAAAILDVYDTGARPRPGVQS